MFQIRSFALGLTFVTGLALSVDAQQRPKAKGDSVGARGRDRAAMVNRGKQGERMRARQARPAPAHPAQAPAIGRELFRGMELTEQERTAIRAIREKHRVANRNLADSLRPALADVRRAHQRGDTAAVRAALMKSTAQRALLRTQVQKQQDEVRQALTAEHRAQFDRNVAQLEARAQGMARGGREAKAGRQGRRGPEGGRARGEGGRPGRRGPGRV